MREPPRRRGARRPCEQMMSRQWRRPPSMLHPAKATAAGTAALLVVGSFSEEEKDLLIKLHALLGNRWSLIAGRLPGRTGEEVKTYWDSQMRTKLKRMGIDPDNHRVHPEEWEEHRAKHPAGHSPASSEDDDIDAAAAGGDDDCEVSDAGSSNRARQGHRLAELNLELTLSTPCASSSEIERTGGAAVN